jgi:hypothetical protein
MTSIDERLIESKITQIEQARSWSPRVIRKSGASLCTTSTIFRSKICAGSSNRQ